MSAAAGALPQTPLRELTVLPRSPSWFQGDALWQEGNGGEGRKGLGGGEREGKGKGDREGENGEVGGGKRHGRWGGGEIDAPVQHTAVPIILPTIITAQMSVGRRRSESSDAGM